MLFLLSGKVQTGKTRWLERAIEELGAHGVLCFGVVAPGVWRRQQEPSGNESFEKLAIDNVLLPERTRLRFATRHDLAKAEGTYSPESQSGRAQLAWAITDEAIARVNDHFDEALAFEASAEPSLLVVDELGRLELLCGEGLVSAVQLLRAGPTEALPHALVVVRDYLAEQARKLLEPAWGSAQVIAPNDEGIEALLQAFGAL